MAGLFHMYVIRTGHVKFTLVNTAVFWGSCRGRDVSWPERWDTIYSLPTRPFVGSAGLPCRPPPRVSATQKQERYRQSQSWQPSVGDSRWRYGEENQCQNGD